MKIKGKIVLASASPRRSALLKDLGMEFSVHPPDVEEILDKSENPKEFTARVALSKAKQVAQALKEEKGAWIISADTTVLCGGKILNKPCDGLQASEMLTMLSGRTHKVVTSFCIVQPFSKDIYTETVETFVTFRELTKREIDWYVSSNEPLDKAGSYGAQGLGSIFIESIEGSYTNVVGLPLSQLMNALLRLGAVEF